jgi:ATP-dependent exoDNAse (exonuclease V) alpha subunit
MSGSIIIKGFIDRIIYPDDYNTPKTIIDFNNANFNLINKGQTPEMKSFTVKVQYLNSKETIVCNVLLNVISPYLVYEFSKMSRRKKNESMSFRNTEIVGREDLEVIFNNPLHKLFLLTEVGLMGTSQKLNLTLEDFISKYINERPNCLYHRWDITMKFMKFTDNYYRLHPLFNYNQLGNLINNTLANKYKIFFPHFCEKTGLTNCDNDKVLTLLFGLCQHDNMDMGYYKARLIVYILNKNRHGCFMTGSYLQTTWMNHIKKTLPLTQPEEFDTALKLAESIDEIKVDYTPDENYVYLASVYYKQLRIAKKLCKIFMSNNTFKEIDTEKFLKTKNKFNLDPEQSNGLYTILLSGISMIDGLPGFGKTEVLLALIYYISLFKKETRMVCTSFVGRMVSTLEEKIKSKCGEDVPDLQVHTIHMAWTKLNWAHSESYEDVEIVACDEAGYLNLTVFTYLIDTYPNCKKIIFIGDGNQIRLDLNIIDDLIKIAGNGHIVLRTNYRSIDTPSITHNTQMLVSKSKNLYSDLKYKHFHDNIDDVDYKDLLVALTVTANSQNLQEAMAEGIKKIITYDVKHSKGVPKPEDIQLISFKNSDLKKYNQYIFNTYHVNNNKSIFYGPIVEKIIQTHYSKNWKTVIRMKGIEAFMGTAELVDHPKFRLGQKIMITHNHKEKIIDGIISDECCNGDTGIIVAVYNVSIPFQAHSTIYTVLILDNQKQYVIHRTVLPQSHIVSGWVKTADKSMGSEYRKVIVVLPPDITMSAWLVRRIIVAFSRGRQKVYLLGANRKQSMSKRRKNNKYQKVDEEDEIYNVIDQLQMIINKKETIYSSRLYELFVEEVKRVKSELHQLQPQQQIQ